MTEAEMNSEIWQKLMKDFGKDRLFARVVKPHHGDAPVVPLVIGEVHEIKLEQLPVGGLRAVLPYEYNGEAGEIRDELEHFEPWIPKPGEEFFRFSQRGHFSAGSGHVSYDPDCVPANFRKLVFPDEPVKQAAPAEIRVGPFRLTAPIQVGRKYRVTESNVDTPYGACDFQKDDIVTAIEILKDGGIRAHRDRDSHNQCLPRTFLDSQSPVAEILVGQKYRVTESNVDTPYGSCNFQKDDIVTVDEIVQHDCVHAAREKDGHGQSLPKKFLEPISQPTAVTQILVGQKYRVTESGIHAGPGYGRCRFEKGDLVVVDVRCKDGCVHARRESDKIGQYVPERFLEPAISVPQPPVDTMHPVDRRFFEDRVAALRAGAVVLDPKAVRPKKAIESPLTNADRMGDAKRTSDEINKVTAAAKLAYDAKLEELLKKGK
jgi:hypothetical protein